MLWNSPFPCERVQQQHWGKILFPLCLYTDQFGGVVGKVKFPLQGWNAGITNDFYFESRPQFQSPLPSNLQYRIHPLAAKQALEFELPSHCKKLIFWGQDRRISSSAGVCRALAAATFSRHIWGSSPPGVTSWGLTQDLTQGFPSAHRAFFSHDTLVPEFIIQSCKGWNSLGAFSLGTEFLLP